MIEEKQKELESLAEDLKKRREERAARTDEIRDAVEGKKAGKDHKRAQSAEICTETVEKAEEDFKVRIPPLREEDQALFDSMKQELYSIKIADFTELKTLKHPPELVKKIQELTLELLFGIQGDYKEA